MRKGTRGPATCSEPGCDGPLLARGMCNKHYLRWKAAGGQVTPRVPIDERFWSKVDKDGPTPECRSDLGPCWLWSRGKNQDGYGRFTVRDRYSVMAHRWAYEQLVGPIPDGLTLDHLCRVRHCINPAHLEPVSRGENTLRGRTITGVNRGKTHCMRGHPFTPENTAVRGSHRMCRICRLDNERKRRAQKRRRLT